MKPLRPASIVGFMLMLMSFHGVVTAQNPNCSIVGVSPGAFDFPSSGGVGNVAVFVDFGCNWSASCSGPAIFSGGGAGNGQGTFSFFTNTNSSAAAIGGQCTVVAGSVGAATVSVTVNPPTGPPAWLSVVLDLLSN